MFEKLINWFVPTGPTDPRRVGDDVVSIRHNGVEIDFDPPVSFWRALAEYEGAIRKQKTR